jgi:hypothetical protein
MPGGFFVFTRRVVGGARRSGYDAFLQEVRVGRESPEPLVLLVLRTAVRRWYKGGTAVKAPCNRRRDAGLRGMPVMPFHGGVFSSQTDHAGSKPFKGVSQ